MSKRTATQRTKRQKFGDVCSFSEVGASKTAKRYNCIKEKFSNIISLQMDKTTRFQVDKRLIFQMEKTTRFLVNKTTKICLSS